MYQFNVCPLVALQSSQTRHVIKYIKYLFIKKVYTNTKMLHNITQRRARLMHTYSTLLQSNKAFCIYNPEGKKNALQSIKCTVIKRIQNTCNATQVA